MFTVRVAGQRDAPALGVIGPAAYAESYGAFWDDAAAYADQLATFDAAAMADFIARPDTRTWLVERGDRALGFLSLVIGSSDPIEARPGGAEIARIYLLAPARGRGLAALMAEAANDHARARGAEYLWLDAMIDAPWAWRTYVRWGFEEIGAITFPGAMKPERRGMIVLKRPCR